MANQGAYRALPILWSAGQLCRLEFIPLSRVLDLALCAYAQEPERIRHVEEDERHN